MRKTRRILFTILCFCLLLSCTECLLPRASAASAMTASESCIGFIMDTEGFSSKPYYDYKQYTIGYGTKCPSGKYTQYLETGITRPEAEALLRKTVSEIEATIYQKLIKKYGLSFSQHQFDALVSFSFNVGTSWLIYDSSLRNAILHSGSNDDLVYAFSLYCTAGGNYSSGLLNRRLCEANMFLNGVYSKKADGSFGYVFYEPNGGKLDYQVQGFLCNRSPAPAADPVRSEDTFLGWYTDPIGGTRVTALSSVLSGSTLFARWQSSENVETEDPLSVAVRVTTNVLNIRKGPGTHYALAQQVYKNDVLFVSYVIEQSGMKWAKAQEGWVCLDYTDYDAVVSGTEDPEPTDPEQPSDEIVLPEDLPAFQEPLENTDSLPDLPKGAWGTVRVNDFLAIRSGPGTTYSATGSLRNGSQVEVLEQKYTGSTAWGKISQGWICLDYVVFGDHHTEPTVPRQEVMEPEWDTESTCLTGQITADALMIRSGPGVHHSVIGFYYQNEVVTITEKVQIDTVFWGKTNKGWIHMNYVASPDTPNHSPEPEDHRVKTVIADCLRVRKQIGTNNRIAELLYYGDQITVYETRTVDDTVWGRVRKGWICMDYVE